MIQNYETDLKILLALEGGYVNHPDDPGGETNKGVTRAVYDGFRRRLGLPTRSVKFIEDSELNEIYRAQYANKVWYDKLPGGVDGVLFDGAVNSGPVQSIKWLQRALGTVKVDGVMGNGTLDAVLSFPDNDLLVARIIEKRMAFLKALKTWKTFGKGWTNRVNHVKKHGQLMATGSVGVDPVYFPGGEAKAVITDAKSLPSKAIADATTGGGIIVTTINQSTDALQHITFIPGVEHLIGIATATGGLMIAGGVLYRMWAKKREAALTEALDLKGEA